ncbi:rab GTPase-binding effector protein 1 isoform X2 [Bicyclus anynana]|uniref:Rab GTPase-binding effector protein 1 isoform X2 n=1 Tax=Bicyclus anynana TaxID=110368 RepID=A0A6J1MT90_BICAN|nr:rab GTPase-binding effector protein 1 isoform X2 [Bicyclus anynana]
MDEQVNPSSAPAGSKVAPGAEDGTAAESARRDLEEEFNMQRARMKELFLQKEEDLRSLMQEKQHLDSEVMGLRAELQQLQTLSENQKSEIQSLQLLVNETVEVSSSGSEEVRRLTARNLELEKQLAQLKQQSTFESALVPGGGYVRSLARKLALATDEQPVRRNEESELTTSIIEPLEMEISALKDKLRQTDAQLQETLAKVTNTDDTAASGTDAKPDAECRQPCDMCANYEQQLVTEQARVEFSRDRAAHFEQALKLVSTCVCVSECRPCDMCANYEQQLVTEQARVEFSRDRAAHFEQALKLATEELEGVRSVHDETIRSWQAERAESSRRLAELAGSLSDATAELAKHAAAADAASRRTLESVTALTVKRELLEKKLSTLERDNAMLVGEFTKKAAEMQNEVINLPNNVADLHEQSLQMREQLIFCETGRQRALAGEEELRKQLLQTAAQLHRRDNELAQALQRLKNATEELDRLQTEREQMTELADKLRHSNDMIEQLLEDKKRLQTEALETRTRVAVLQQELDNSEKVQQDFVRLSQSLQVQLQRIREADTAVRWQHDEDVADCNACRAPLPNNKKKIHCRHCGRIFCAACVAHSVPSGPRGLPARVCSVCLTLLQPHAAPYFSTRPPHSPD